MELFSIPNVFETNLVLVYTHAQKTPKKNPQKLYVSTCQYENFFKKTLQLAGTNKNKKIQCKYCSNDEKSEGFIIKMTIKLQKYCVITIIDPKSVLVMETSFINNLIKQFNQTRGHQKTISTNIFIRKFQQQKHNLRKTRKHIDQCTLTFINSTTTTKKFNSKMYNQKFTIKIPVLYFFEFTQFLIQKNLKQYLLIFLVSF
eukprot:TRINITY_DN28090_c0_g2_i1.p2 TRINITY_DN28090_c0_g2~~TRINITY_DN28090_c0_g2_i1.p2  ORF type:complete len:201 (-),score=10.08 TRINITY_DN28090_c0_g2_i1:978-1580(-)